MATARSKSRSYHSPFLALCVFLGLLLILSVSCTKKKTELEAGAMAPDFRAETLTGQTLYLNAEIKTRPVLISFFATWCDPCRAELPLLATLQRKFPKDLQVLLVAIDPENVDEHHTLAKALSLPFPILLDKNERIKTAYGVEQLPSTFLVDQQGVIRSILKAIGEPEVQYLEKTVRKALENH